MRAFLQPGKPKASPRRPTDGRAAIGGLYQLLSVGATPTFRSAGPNPRTIREPMPREPYHRSSRAVKSANRTTAPRQIAPATPPSRPGVGVAARDPSPGSYGRAASPTASGTQPPSGRQESTEPRRKLDRKPCGTPAIPRSRRNLDRVMSSIPAPARARENEPLSVTERPRRFEDVRGARAASSFFMRVAGMVHTPRARSTSAPRTPASRRASPVTPARPGSPTRPRRGARTEGVAVLPAVHVAPGMRVLPRVRDPGERRRESSPPHIVAERTPTPHYGMVKS